jgi:hypothetical protein
MVEINLFKGVHQLVDGLVLPRRLPLRIIINLHNDQINFNQLYSLPTDLITSFQPYSVGLIR